MNSGMRFGRKLIWARAFSTLSLVCAPLLLPTGANASGADHASGAQATPNQFKIACSQSFEESQRLRNSSEYIAASSEVLKCANPSCGQALFDECTKIYGELQTATPSVVFAARDGAGNELTRVAVSIDGHLSLELLDGKPLSVDPGSHRFSFSSEGYASAEQTVLILAGEHFRPINATLKQKAVASAAVQSELSTAPTKSRGGPPLASYVLGGVAAVGFGTFVAFRVVGANQFEAFERDCKPNCTDSEVNSVRQKYAISNIALGIGSVAAVAAVTVYLVSPAGQNPKVALQLSPSPQTLGAHLRGTF
jgi:hypothetical protein